MTTASDEMERAPAALPEPRYRDGVHRERHEQGDEYSPMVDLGYNYRLTDLACALGLSQLAKLDQFLKRRAELAQRYRTELARQAGAPLPDVHPMSATPGTSFRSCWTSSGSPPIGATILAALRAENIGATVHYVPVYWHPYYQAAATARAVPACGMGLRAPPHAAALPGDERRDADDVLAAVRKVLGHYLR